jgi:SAM-dependent methyltransferase
MRELVMKVGGRVPFPLVRADGTRAPFTDGSFGGAYARWVLHLIPNWRDAVAELCRIVGPGGRVVIEPGGYAGQWRTVWLKFVEIVGEDAAPIGLDVRGGMGDLDEAFAASGAEPRELPPIDTQVGSSLNVFFDEVADRLYSWTWRVSEDELLPAIERVRDWASREYGDLDGPFDTEARLRWRAYDISSP